MKFLVRGSMHEARCTKGQDANSSMVKLEARGAKRDVTELNASKEIQIRA